MKKNLRTLSAFLLFLSLSLFESDFFVSKSLLYADDNLKLLQQEVIYAKEKQQAIPGKIDTIGSLLEKERFSSQGTEAENFIRDLIKKQPSDHPVEFKVEAPTTKAPAAKVSVSSAGKGVGREKVPKKSKGWFGFSYGEEKAISDGEALYKVAVSDGTLTLEEAIQIALANNLQARAAKKKVEVARAKLTEARRALFPTVQGVLEYNGGKNQGDDDVPAGRLYKGESKKINISQPLFHGGELKLTVKQAESNLKLAEEEYKKVRNESIHQVRTAYFGAVKQEYNLQYQLSLLRDVGAVHKQVREAHLQKLISEIDFLNVDSQYNQAYFQVESAKNDLLSANLLLRQNLSLMSDEPLPIDLKLRYQKLELDFDELLKIALKQNPELRMKEFALESAAYGVQIYGAKKLPRVDLKGSYGMLGEAFHDTRAFRDHKADNDLEKEWFLGVQASMPLGPNSIEYSQIKHKYGPTALNLRGSEDWSNKVTFNLLDKFSEITDEKSAEATYLQAQSDLRTARNNVMTQLRDNFYNLKKALVQMDSAVSKIKYQERQSAAARYLVGLSESPPSSLLESLIELTSHKFSLIQAVVDYQLAISNLNLSTGDPNYFETEP